MADKSYDIECSNFGLLKEIKSYLQRQNVGWVNEGIGPSSISRSKPVSVVHITAILTLKQIYEIELMMTRYLGSACLIIESKKA